MRVVVIILLQILIFHGAIRFIIKNDLECVLENKKEYGIYFLFSILTTLMYIKYGITLDLFFLSFFLIYLIISAYIDKKTLTIYSFYNYLTTLIGIVYLLAKLGTINITNIIFNVIIFVCITIIASKLGAFKDGDTELFISISFFLYPQYPNFALEIFLINIIISYIVVLILNFRRLDKTNFLKFKEPIAFAPSIAISTIILLLL